jgi:hypothetical protein
MRALVVLSTSWNSVLAECDKNLEPEGQQQAIGVKNINDLRNELVCLPAEHQDREDESRQRHHAPLTDP